MERNIKSIKSTHPDAAHQLLSGKEIRSFIAAHFNSDVVAAYDLLKPYSYRADLARYCLLFIHGGLYVDLGIRLLTRFEPPLGAGLAIFRDLLTGPGTWGVSTGLVYAQAGRPELRTAIDLLVQNCKDRYYGATCLDPTGPGLFGRAIAICNNGLDYWMGDMRMTTPEFDHKNAVYITPDGKLLAQITKKGNVDALAIDGTNNYAVFWRWQQVYGEHHSSCFGIVRMYTEVATRTQDSFLIKRDARGCAFHGPYIPLVAGRYTINLHFDPDTKLGSSTVDVCANSGVDILKALKAGEFSMDKDGRVSFELELASTLQNVEVRMQTNGDCEGRFLKTRNHPA